MGTKNEFDSDYIKEVIEKEIERKISKKEIAIIGEVNQSSLNHWDSKYPYQIKFLVNISKHFKIPIDRLLKK